MILANVAAAEELEARQQACMYRVHDEPSAEKLARACAIFSTRSAFPGSPWRRARSSGRRCSIASWSGRARRRRLAVVNELVLRSQAQAVYSPNNIGHFGLALPRYAHFTSPIRRYADLIVHRALIGGAAPARQAEESLGPVGEHISGTERRAAAAERAALDRYQAALLSGAVGTVYDARITGVASFGLFASLPESGADGLIPISTLPSDYYDHDPTRHRLVGRRSERVFALGDAVRVVLVEADPIGGRLVFRLDEATPARPKFAAWRGPRGPRGRRR